MKEVLESPQSLSAAIGELDGEINLQWDSVQGANSYIIEFCRNKQNPSWRQIDIVSLSRYTITDLKAKSTYSFRVAAINGKAQGPWSEAVTKKI